MCKGRMGGVDGALWPCEWGWMQGGEETDFHVVKLLNYILGVKKKETFFNFTTKFPF